MITETELVTRVFYCDQVDQLPNGDARPCERTATLTQPRTAITLPEGWRWIWVRSGKPPFRYRRLSCGQHGEVDDDVE